MALLSTSRSQSRPGAREGAASVRSRRRKDAVAACLFLAPQLTGLVVFMVGPLARRCLVGGKSAAANLDAWLCWEDEAGPHPHQRRHAGAGRALCLADDHPAAPL